MAEGNFIGLDVSLTATGFVVIGPNGELIKKGVVKSKPQKDRIGRCIKICSELLDEVNPYPEDRILIEGYAMGVRGGGQVFNIAELGGILRYMLRVDMEVPAGRIWEVAPSSMKKFVTGKGNVQKDIIMRDAMKRWGFEDNDNNVVDAYCLAKMLYFAFNMPSAENKNQVECLQKLREYNGHPKWVGGKEDSGGSRNIQEKKGRRRRKRKTEESPKATTETPKSDTGLSVFRRRRRKQQES